MGSWLSWLSGYMKLRHENEYPALSQTLQCVKNLDLVTVFSPYTLI